MSTPSRTQTLAAGLALILAPLLAIILKFTVEPGWLIVVLFFAAVPLLLGYALQVVLAATGMFRARGVFNTVPGARRGTVAAWITSISVFLSAFFIMDGGYSFDSGSAFTLLFLGESATPTSEELSMSLAVVFGLSWLLSWGWLMVEWIVLGIRSREAKPTEAGTAGAQMPHGS